MTNEHLTLGRKMMHIDGQWLPSADETWIPVDDPGRLGHIVGEVPSATEQDVDRAVKAAAKAYQSWKLVSARERGRLMQAIGRDLAQEAEELGRIIASENGNAIRTQARPEAQLCAELFNYFGGVAGELKGETVPFGEDSLCYTRPEPLGVVGAVVPWNAPALLAVLKITMAVTAGNTIVLKGSVEAPLNTVKLIEVCARHLPPGVVNLVSGSGSRCGRYLIEHPGLAKLSFTGSTEVGRTVFHAAADKIIPVTLELGGKNPQIVFPDSDDEATVANVISGMRFARQGQSCTAGARLYVHETIFDSFLDKLVERLKAFKVGDPLDEASDAGAVVSQKQFRRVCGYIRDGLSQPGARAITGGLPPADGPLAGGYYIEPTVFTGIEHDWRLAREEIFGPVMAAIPWRDEDEVIAQANDTHYGLAAFVHCRDMSRALRAAHGIEAGFLQVNQGAGQWPGQSYGGFKQSGFGREFSLEGMKESFTGRKTVTVNLRH